MLDRYALDGRSLIAFRVAIGALLLFDLAARGPDLVAFYSDAGAVPRALADAEYPAPIYYQLFFLSGSPVATALGLAVFGVFAIGLVVGRFTRICTIACWLLWCAWMARNPYVLNFGDRILRLALFWAIFLPLEGRRSGVTVAALAYQLQIVFVYFVGALHKLDPIWTSGQAISYVLNFDQVTRPLGHLLADHPRLMEALTYATLVFEGVLAPLVFSPWRTAWWRTITVASAIAFHLGLAVTMFLGHFPFVCMAVWLPFLPGAFWEKLGWSSEPTDAAPPANFIQGIAATALAIVVAYNVATLAGDRTVPAWLDSSARSVALDQRWTMFAPHPSTADGWFVIAGRTADGTVVDAWQGDAVARYSKPADPTERYSNYRWMSYMVKLHAGRETSAQAQHLASYLCRRWNDAHADAPLERLAIDFMQERTLPGGFEDAPVRVPVVSVACEPGRVR